MNHENHLHQNHRIDIVYGLVRLVPCKQKELTVGPMRDRVYGMVTF